MIITIGILIFSPNHDRICDYDSLILDSQEPGQLTFSSLVVLSGVFVLIIIGTILIIQGQRKIPCNMQDGLSDGKKSKGAMPISRLKINYAGVIPVIFASSLLMFPATIGQFVGRGSWVGQIRKYDFPWNLGLHGILCHVNYFFYLFLDGDPISSGADRVRYEEKRAFIPGIRQGKPTQDYLESTMSRITFAGAIFLAIDCNFADISRKIVECGFFNHLFFWRHFPIDFSRCCPRYIETDRIASIDEALRRLHEEGTVARTVTVKF